MGGADELFGTEQTPSVSGADQLFAGEESQAENRLKFVMDETIDETPERTARALEIQKKTGIPKKFIDENFDEVDKTARQADFNPAQYTKSNPKIADWLSRNPDYAPLIREDEGVGALESAISNTSKFFSSGESWSDVLQKRTESAGHALNLQLAGAEQTVAMARQAPSEFSGHFGAQINRAAAKGMAYLVAPDWALTPEQIKTKETFINRIAPEPGYSQTAIDTISKDLLFVEGMDRASYHTERIKELQPKVPEWSGKDLIGSAYESFLTSVLPMMATAYAGGGVLGGTSIFSGQVYTLNLAEDLNEGMPLSLAQEHASWKVLSEGIPESIPLSVAMKAGKGFWSKTLTVALVEGVEEGLTEMADVAYETLKLDKDISFKEAVNRTFKAMAIGSITGGGMGAVSSIPTAIENHKLKQKAKVQEDFFTALGENATNSKLRERLPDSYQEIIGELTKDGPVENVYTPVEFFQSHFQEQGIDPRQLATELGIVRQYDEALNTGGKIAIPTAVYAKNLAPTEHNAVFAKELSFGPDQMSARETEEFLKEAEKEKEPEVDTFGESLTQAMTPIREQLKAIYPADVADKNAAVIEARLRSRASRLGIDPQELMKQRPLEITEGGAETGSVLNQLAYHGSPYKFQRFDMSKIGTGEGAQAYGHGLYFAESPGVAKAYQEQLRPQTEINTLSMGGVPLYKNGVSVDYGVKGPHTLDKEAMALLQEDLLINEWQIKEAFDKAGEDGVAKIFKEAIDSRIEVAKQEYPEIVKSYEKIKKRFDSERKTADLKKGESHIYKVDISEDAIKNFLDWDRPLSEQPHLVDIVRKHIPGYMTAGMPNKQIGGSDAYLSLAEKVGDDKASELFKEAGIPGIRYLDQGSRGKGEGTSNYVVFDDSIIKILDVNGEPVPKQEQKKIVDAMHNEGELFQSDVKKQKTTVKSVRNSLVKKGWRINREKNGSVYLSPPGDMFADKEIRVSDHELGTTRYGESQGSRWGTNIVVNPELSLDDHLLAIEDEDYASEFELGYSSEDWKAIVSKKVVDENGKPLFQGKDIKRGSISVTPTGDIIRLFKAKNLSTLLHELSHRWLFEMQDDANLPDAPQQIKDDLAATLKYLGLESVEQADITRFAKGTKEYARAVAANEKFAQSGEAYLMEGKAPSTALRRVFAQIRAWLVAVYKALKQGRLDVELTPEMRNVFDRLLATDQEIEAARSEANSVPIFTTSVDAGMTDTEFSAYRKTVEDANREAREELDAKVMKEYKKTLTDLWKEEKAKVQVEVEAELDADPVYTAMRKMKENDIKIARSEAGSLPRSFTAKEGIPADMAAELLGFTSGEAMVKALASVEARGARVSRETNIRMDQRFGNLLTDGALVEEARKAVMGDGRAKIIEAEIKALNKKAREVEPFVKAKEKAQTEQKRAGRDLYKALVPKLASVREHAAAVIAGKPIRELRPMQYYNAARQASREAVNDVRKGDYLMAGYNKGRELLNLELYREAIKAKDLIEDGNQKLQKVFVSDIKQSKSRNMDMVNAARAILASHGLGKTDESPSSYLKKMRQYDPEVYENLRPIFEPAIASMKPFKEMTVEEYVGMRDAVLALVKTSRRSKQIEIDGKLIERDEVVANLVNRLIDFDKGKSQALKSTLDDLQKTKIGLLSAKAALRRVESWVSAMDGGQDGVFRKFIWNPVMDAVNLYRDEKRKVVAHYLDIVQEVAPTIKPGDIEAPELGFKFRGKNELLHALLHTGNESNKAKLLIGYGWGERTEEGALDSRKWDAFEKRMRDQGTLTKADYDFAQNVWDMMEGMKPVLQEAHHRMYGYYFNEVTAKEFSNEFGTYRGGYVPAKVDVNVVQEAEQRKDAEEIVQGQNSFAFPTSGKGATMSRVEGYARPLQLDMRTIPAHIDWAMRFAYLEPAVKDVARVVLDKDFAKSMNGLDPTTINHMLVPWLQRTAQQLTSTRGMNKWVDKFWTGVRGRAGMQVMVLNVINTLQQYTGLTIAFTRVKPSNIRSAFWQYMTNHKAMAEEINEKSLFMRNRVFTSHNEVMQTIDDLLLNPSKYEKAKDFATKHGYFMQQATQGLVDQVVWHAAYSESLASEKSDVDAVRHADSVVRETQGSFAPEDLSRFEAGTPFVRAFSMFYNYFNMQANLLGTEFSKIASNELGLRKGAGRALYVYIFAFMIPAYVGGSLIRALVAGQPDDDDDGYMDDLIRMFFSSQFEALTAMVPVAGSLLNTAVNQWNKKWYDDKITTSPAVTMVESAARAPHSVYKAIVEDGNEKRAVKDTLSLIGMATGLPAGALGRPLGYLADVHQGKANPENFMDVTRGLISGQDVNRK